VVLVAVAAGALLAGVTAAGAQSSDAYRPPAQYGNDSVYRPVQQAPSGYDGSAGGASPGSDGVYRPREGDTYRQGDAYSPRGGDPYSTERGGYSPGGGGQYGEPYAPPREPRGERYEGDRYRDDGRGGYADGGPGRGAYTQNEILGAGHRFFGKVSQGFANVIEYVFQKSGRPNGYILGEDAGGAFVAGLRYGEGRLYTKDAGEHPVYWQARRSATTSVPTDRRRWSSSTIFAIRLKSMSDLVACRARPTSWAGSACTSRSMGMWSWRQFGPASGSAWVPTSAI